MTIVSTDPKNDISDGGERVSHLRKDIVYFAHLSIYKFASVYAGGADVLDAGCGAGYGSAYLADSGARQVWGVDASEKAIGFCRQNFARANLTFRKESLERLTSFRDRTLDFIFTSNTLEHVPQVHSFLRKGWEALKPDGKFLIAVPPITDDRLIYLNLINPFHINIWSPRQWMHLLGLFFAEVTPIRHGVRTIGKDFLTEDFALPSPVTEDDFPFQPCSLEDMYSAFTLTSLFLAQAPRAEHDVPPPGFPVSFIDDSFTRPAGMIDPKYRKRFQRFFDLPSPPYTEGDSTEGAAPLWRRGIRRLRAAGRNILNRLR